MALSLGLPSTAALAQAEQALAEAQSRAVCAPGTLVNATYVGNGLLRVTCSRATPRTPSENGLPRTGLGAAPAIAGLAVVTLIAISGGGDTPSTTTGESVALE